MTNYRSSSQVSIFNYPEHLNPFYEDDQHKRLRFWKIGNSQTGSRRRSFNLGSIKDFLPLKSFRLRKRSSASGINQTSESPPPVKREFMTRNAEDVAKFSTYDPHFRNNVSTDNINGFQRNNDYRSSLLNKNDYDFAIRNSRYRSTIHNASPQAKENTERFIYSGSITPTPRSRYLEKSQITPGSSMTSVSMNPFELDDDTLTIGSISNISNCSHRTRKKRRAPLPPVSMAANVSKTEEDELKIRNEERENKGLEELSRLTAEFESFLRTSQDDAVEKLSNGQSHPTNNVEAVNLKTKEKTFDNQPEESITKLNIQQFEKATSKNFGPQPKGDDVAVMLHENDSVLSKSDVETVELKIEETEILTKNGSELEIQKTPTAVCQYTEAQKASFTSSREATPDYIPLTVIERFHGLENESEKNSSNDQQENEKNSQSSSTNIDKFENIYETDLIITEMSPNQSIAATSVLQKQPSQNISRFREQTPDLIARTKIDNQLNMQGFFRVEKPIKFYDDIETFIRKKTHLSEENIINVEEPPKPPERRRSVKDIIESINRSQQLLKVNRPPSPQFERKSYYESQTFSNHVKPLVPPKSNALLKLQLQIESGKKPNCNTNEGKSWLSSQPRQ